MMTVKLVQGPSRRVFNDKGKQIFPGKLTDPKVKETVTHSTIIKIDGKYISLSVTKHLGYAKDYELDHKLPLPKKINLFEELFYWPLEDYSNPISLTYKRIKESNYYYQSGLDYELQWEEIKVEEQFDSKGNLQSITIANKDRSHLIAIPHNSNDEPRYDYLTDDGKYHYGCKKDECEGIEIVVNKYKNA